MTPELAEAESTVKPSPEEQLLGRIVGDMREGDVHRAMQAIYHYRFEVTRRPGVPEVERIETVEWGVRFAKGSWGVRWDPSQGGRREPTPYTEAEAREDSRVTGYPVVKRTRVTYQIDDEVTEWEIADE